jgi:hypothetical protein
MGDVNQGLICIGIAFLLFSGFLIIKGVSVAKESKRKADDAMQSLSDLKIQVNEFCKKD